MSKRYKVKGRTESGSFLALPRSILNSDEYCCLSAAAVKLLIDLATQYRGNNNGDLCCAWKLMQPRGWKSRDTLYKAQRELERSGFILRARQGGRNSANLFAITWKGIDECKGKLDISANPVPLNLWKRLNT